MDISRAKDILDFWFSKGRYTPDYKKWFTNSTKYDKQIQKKFGDLLTEAEHGKGFGWLVNKDSYVAHIILMDQFSRHIYRGTKDAFKNDKGCLIFAELGWELYKEELQGYEFMFAFMPYMHTENLLYQKKGEAHFSEHIKLYYNMSYYDHVPVKRPFNIDRITCGRTGKTKTSSSEKKTNNDIEWEMLESIKDLILSNTTIVQIFGRFPHRNQVLGRKTTKEEQQYLDDKENENILFHRIKKITLYVGPLNWHNYNTI